MSSPLDGIPMVSRDPQIFVNAGSLKLPAKVNVEFTKACAACGISKAELLRTMISQFITEFGNVQNMLNGTGAKIDSAKIELKIREVTTK